MKNQSNKIAQFRRNLKLKSVAYKWWNCIKCGYNKCVDALDFHHLDPLQKEFRISDWNIRSWERIKKELDKCVLLCANCHALEHLSVNHVVQKRTQTLEEICFTKNNNANSIDKFIIKNCLHHWKAIYIYQNRWAYRCTQCMIDSTKKKLIVKKNKIYETSWCICNICKKEYHKNIIQFHHINPNNKLFWISSWLTLKYSLEKILLELKKCAVLCTNCHREVHAWLHKEYINNDY